VCVCSTSIVVRAQMVRPPVSPCAHLTHPVPRVPGELAGQQRAECRVSSSVISTVLSSQPGFSFILQTCSHDLKCEKPALLGARISKLGATEQSGNYT
jgi:hypothetical protein